MSKGIRRIFICILCLMLTFMLTGCSLLPIPGSGDPEKPGREQADTLPAPTQAAPAADYTAVDAFLEDCADKLDSGAYTQLERDEEHVPCGREVMILIIDKTGGSPEYVRSREDTIAYVPDQVGEENLCWDPEKCDTVFVIYSEMDDESYYHYDNGTDGFACFSMLCVIDPKAGTLWGPELVYSNPPPHEVTGAGVSTDTYADFEVDGALQHLYLHSTIPVRTLITYPNEDERFFILNFERYTFLDEFADEQLKWMQSGLSLEAYCETYLEGPVEAFSRPTEWRDLDGLVLTGDDGATLTIHSDPETQHAVTATYTGPEGDIACDLLMLPDAPVIVGEKIYCYIFTG